MGCEMRYIEDGTVQLGDRTGSGRLVLYNVVTEQAHKGWNCMVG